MRKSGYKLNKRQLAEWREVVMRKAAAHGRPAGIDRQVQENGWPAPVTNEAWRMKAKLNVQPTKSLKNFQKLIIQDLYIKHLNRVIDKKEKYIEELKRVKKVK